MKENKNTKNIVVENNDSAENNIHLLLDVHERPKSKAQWILLSLQHVFAMFGATVLVPLIINGIATSTKNPVYPGEVMNISMALFCSGVGTLIYIALTAAKVPMYLGSSFAYMSGIGAAYPLYGNATFVAIMLVGVIYIIFGTIIHFLGKDFLEKILPAIVIGPMIIIIGMSVAPTAINNTGLNSNNWTESYSNWIGIGIAAFTFLVTIIASLKLKGFGKMVAIIIGVVAGYIFSAILHFAIPDANILNVDLLNNTSKWEWYPSFKGFWNDIKPSDIGAAILTVTPLAIIAMAEHIGDHISMGYLTGKNFVKNPGIHRTLIADGVSIIFDGMVGGPPNTTYGENASVVGMTKVASVWVTGLAAIMAIILSFVAPVNQLILMMPKPVMGGISIIMFGFIATNGIRILAKNNIDFQNMRNIIIMSTVLVIGLGGAVLGFTSGNSKLLLSGSALAAFIGVILNLVLPQNINQGFHIYHYLKSKFKSRKKD
ncbi:uracil-xanthine permease family protein [Williamsoniiplasma lucivorax]|uniref:Uracil permease n=1 Tax=Williamsoniiplasma lucivorax TaxID=209274 RepID=A0A2S5RF69_9MOLU|nr:uracil-xanthine permease family protein [Williamsoniiplasma lucivorax]PPE05938.1 uracil permease [Williamsoniiplasma lucivorax]